MQSVEQNSAAECHNACEVPETVQATSVQSLGVALDAFTICRVTLSYLMPTGLGEPMEASTFQSKVGIWSIFVPRAIQAHSNA
jgi:Na+/alanine symporter